MVTPSLVIDVLVPDHAEALAVLMEEMQAHYRVPCPPRDQILAGLGDLPPGVTILIAVYGEAVVGFAAASPIYPGPGLCKGLFLKELYVSRDWRGKGVGRGLLRQLAILALRDGYGRIDWTADRADVAIMAFYEAAGAVAQDSKRFYRLTGDALRHLGG